VLCVLVCLICLTGALLLVIPVAGITLITLYSFGCAGIFPCGMSFAYGVACTVAGFVACLVYLC
jgi:hypothetical protein